MNAKVKVVAVDATGNVIVQSQNNPEFGYVRLEQARTMIDDNGFLRRKVVSTLLHGTVQELKDSNFHAGQELSGNIVIIESLQPFNKKNPERDIKQAGATGIICSVEGQPIYRKTLYTLISNVTDQLIKHDNTAQMKAAYDNAKVSAVNPAASDEFNI